MTALAADAGALLVRLGARVRDLRQARGLSRQALSEGSGVSPRYLAQLEAGEGNASIVVLHKVAEALGVPTGQLLLEQGDGAEIARRFDAAAPPVQAQVRALLGDASSKAGRICLIGLRGAGKSTLGTLLADALNLPFVELSREIETLASIPVTEVIALYGPDGFRRLEAKALAKVIAREDRLVLAVAGGIVADPATFAQLRAAFHTVWLRATPEDHMARVRAQGDTRPMAGHPQAMAELREILRQRAPLYGQADAVLDTSGQSLDDTAQALMGLVQAQFLDAPRYQDRS